MEPAWLDMDKKDVLQEVYMEASLARLPPVTTILIDDISKLERVQVPLASITPLSIVHPLMDYPFLSPANAWHILDANVQAMGIS